MLEVNWLAWVFLSEMATDTETYLTNSEQLMANLALAC